MKTVYSRRQHWMPKARNCCRLAGICALIPIASPAGAQAISPPPGANATPAARILTGHTGAVNCVAFAPDSKTLVSAGQDGSIRLWDVRSGKEIRRFTRPNNPVAPMRAVAFSPDGATLASGDMQGRLRL